LKALWPLLSSSATVNVSFINVRQMVVDHRIFPLRQYLWQLNLLQLRYLCVLHEIVPWYGPYSWDKLPCNAPDEKRLIAKFLAVYSQPLCLAKNNSFFAEFRKCIKTSSFLLDLLYIHDQFLDSYCFHIGANLQHIFLSNSESIALLSPAWLPKTKKVLCSWQFSNDFV
jgi:hypothetical protein